MIEETIADADERMQKAVEHVQNEFGTVRTGRPIRQFFIE